MKKLGIKDLETTHNYADRVCEMIQMYKDDHPDEPLDITNLEFYVGMTISPAVFVLNLSRFGREEFIEFIQQSAGLMWDGVCKARKKQSEVVK